MQATCWLVAPGRIHASTHCSKASFARCAAPDRARQRRSARQPSAETFRVRPAHLSKARFRPCTPVRAQLVSDTETARECLEATVKATEHLLRRKAIDSSILLQGMKAAMPPMLAQHKGKTQGATAGFGWTSCDQTSWYKQLQQKVDLFKVRIPAVQPFCVQCQSAGPHMNCWDPAESWFHTHLAPATKPVSIKTGTAQEN